jgi:phytoene dehydrogenase-like protein
VSRVVVRGDGPAGLAVAARLARLRHDVTVLTSGTEPPADALRLRLPAALRDLFLKTGEPVETVLGLSPAASLAQHALRDGNVLELPNSGEQAVAAAFGAAFGGSAEDDWLRLMAHARRLWDVVRVPFIEQPPMSHRGWYRTHPRATRELLAGRTLHGLARRHLRDRRQRRAFETCATRHGADPRRTRPALCVVPWVEQAFRIWEVDGGTGALQHALMHRATSRGVRCEPSPGDQSETPDVVILDRSTWVDESRDVRLTPPERNPAPGLYVVGDDAFPGSDISLGLMSAAAVADHIGRAR